MQDRYFGDIGDFAKYGLLRAVAAGEPPLRLAVLWYLVPDESHTKDGRHIDYLEPTPNNLESFRACDPELYDKLGDLVGAGTRAVSAVPEHALLPPQTVYHDASLDYSAVPRAQRPALRGRWLASAVEVAGDADVVFLDPDNGLEAGCGPCDTKGPKYAFYADLLALSPDKTLVVYQHSTRTGTFEEQIENRMVELCDRLRRPRANAAAMRWRRAGPRAFLFVIADAHRTAVLERLRVMTDGPWGAHFELRHPELTGQP